MRKGVFYTVSGEDRRRLEAIANDPSAQHKHVWRARIILEGANALDVASDGEACWAGVFDGASDFAAVWPEAPPVPEVQGFERSGVCCVTSINQRLQ